MALYFRTSADKVATKVTDDIGPIVTPKYVYSAVVDDTSFNFSIDNATNWGVNKDAYIRVDDTLDHTVLVTDFVYANLDYTTAHSANITIEDAKRGDIKTGAGDDVITIKVVNSTNAGFAGWDSPALVKDSVFNIDSGDGNDKIYFKTGIADAGLSLGVSKYTLTNIDAGGGDDFVDMGSTGLAQTRDTISGGAGIDTIHAAGGDDVVHGGTENDFIYGESGNDTLYGDDGDDEIQGGTGDDILWGGEGNDFLRGGAGSDEIHGGKGNDKISGGTGTDSLLFGDEGADTFLIGSGDLYMTDVNGQPKPPAVDTIEDYNALEGDTIDVYKPGHWSIDLNADNSVDTHLITSDAPGSMLILKGITGFNTDVLV